MNFHFSHSGIVTVCVLITSTQTALHGSHSPSLSPSHSLSPHLSLHSQTALAVQTLALRHCHTPHWLPWRNSPPGLQGTRVYCLWLLYLDENMICWKGSTCFFAASLCCLFFLLLPPHEHQCNVAWCVLFHSSPFQEFDCACVCVKLVWCFVAINFSVSACQRPRRGAVQKFSPLPQLSPGLIIAFYYQGWVSQRLPVCHQETLNYRQMMRKRSKSFLTAAFFGTGDNTGYVHYIQ